MTLVNIVVLDFGPAIGSMIEKNGGVLVTAVSPDRKSDERKALRHANFVVFDDTSSENHTVEAICRLRKLDEVARIPILVLITADDPNTRLRYLNAGADICLPKPITEQELQAWIRAVARRSPYGMRNESVLRIGGVVIDPNTHKAIHGDRVLDLTLIEFRLLLALASRPEEVLSRDALKRFALCSPNATGRTIDVHIVSLRKKLGEEGRRILSVRGVGYRLLTDSSNQASA